MRGEEGGVKGDGAGAVGVVVVVVDWLHRGGHNSNWTHMFCGHTFTYAQEHTRHGALRWRLMCKELTTVNINKISVSGNGSLFFIIFFLSLHLC